MEKSPKNGEGTKQVSISISILDELMLECWILQHGSLNSGLISDQRTVQPISNWIPICIDKILAYTFDGSLCWWISQVINIKLEGPSWYI